MRLLTRMLVFSAVCLLITGALPAQEGMKGLLLIKGGKIYTMTGKEPVEGDILIRGGKITAVGQGFRMSMKIPTIDAKGKTVIPGLIDADSGFLVEQTAKTPSRIDADVLDAFNRFRTDEMSWALEKGVTCVALNPQVRDGFTGRVAVVKLVPGASMEEMVLRRDVALKAGVGVAGVGNALSRVKLADALDKQFKAAKDYEESWSTYEEELEEYLTKVKERAEGEKKEEGEEKKEKKEKKKEKTAPFAGEKEPAKKNGKKKEEKKEEELKKPKRPAFNPSTDLLVKAMDGEIGVFVEAHRASDILNVLALKERYNLDLTLVGCTEGYRVLDAIEAARVPVILGLVQRPVHEEQSVFLHHDPACARRLADRGISLALSSSGRADLQTRFIASNAALAAGAGLDRDAALKAITIGPAAILGVDDRIGTVEKGKDADLVILSGDPFDSDAVVEQVLINGKTVFKRTE